MDSVPSDVSNSPPIKDPSTSPPAKETDEEVSATVVSGQDNSAHESSSRSSPTGISTWAKNLKISHSFSGSQDDSPGGNVGKSTFARITSNLGLRLSPKSPVSDDSSNETAVQSNLFGTITKGLVDSSKNAVKAVQVKARHVVSQNKRRYQEGGFDLDMTYITENIIAMGFPAGDMSSGFFGYVEGFYRNHMEEVIKFFETHHKGKYKVYNLCSERLYDASLFEGKVASFPFDDHNCPPIQLIISFCQSAYSWLKQDIENVVVVHCKAGMARTGLMISSLLLFLKFFPTAEESMDYYNQKRCIDGKGLVLPSQIRYVKYFERVMTYFNGENPPPRRCMLRGFRLHRCPYWIRPSITVSDHSGVLFSTKKHPRTKDLLPEDFWFSAPKKGVMVFALPGEPGLTELAGDFKIHFHDRQGDFYCWLNTTMTENRKVLNTGDLDGFDKRKLPSPGFMVEVVLVDYNGDVVTSKAETTTKKSDESSSNKPAQGEISTPSQNADRESGSHDKDDVFSDGEAEQSGSSKNKQTKAPSEAVETVAKDTRESESNRISNQIANLSQATEQVALGNKSSTPIHSGGEPKSNDGRTVSSLEVPSAESEFKAMAADASVFTFGDDEDYESD
ncbi:phosphatidylinositol 3,4,5-trisphosphate 3-phosphatase and protein-tyrosine-phosphatase PTEN2A [Abrus precatorius]|uniref:Phosphatidylinositol 3,4,5-trisphosphate 3-phosphatase and protein-tyrosine-phosphatase PTEN2A n=1 Tax=Abrus precatorius TaxID=3816 RepID=A0A8B8M642_ABRPR|nr:phosphatidylinositol 3,4,5-trisphosphate 3-phosphatase and protein-tyrosine-phosphatase PTEN2A [Abrus precatorius]XP_027363448.1 phosphatidylinositol 3,4,5-trisphosphate 3-phosphatase and protein-tyrosine-phosphatase PTEN2A [Abrus precatorius]XP_027363449.1 phosphatidylinositol 3,4,5-trisphosphate 3-phosphatase and protein-tyrosine-phosphatase PTEN2A [Abrus precatorius]XP_027363451.1 phosphatidylinositol 3,4,5-trisphosphate 3-phosphatase and protein-tyrosine-phosphatase PTEN2A [Abrus precator